MNGQDLSKLELLRKGNRNLIFDLLFIDKYFEEKLNLTENALRVPNAWTVVCTSGTAEIVIAGEQLTLEAGMLCVASPSTLIKLVEISDNFTGFLALSGSNFVEQMVRYNVNTLSFFEQHPISRLEEEEYTSLIALCRMAERYVLRREHKFYDAFMKDLASLFLLELLSIYERQRQDFPQDVSRKQQHYMDFIFLLKEHCDDRWCVEDYAQAMSITPRYLTKICQSLSGESAVNCINRYTVDQMCIRLLSTSSSVLEISEQMNFQNMSYFIALFKRYKGCTPQQYRRNPNPNRK